MMSRQQISIEIGEEYDGRQFVMVNAGAYTYMQLNVTRDMSDLTVRDVVCMAVSAAALQFCRDCGLHV